MKLKLHKPKYVLPMKAEPFLEGLQDSSVDLFLIDPPYYGIVEDAWDNQWKNQQDYVTWLLKLVCLAQRKLEPDGSLLMFGGIGKHRSHPLFSLMEGME